LQKPKFSELAVVLKPTFHKFLKKNVSYVETMDERRRALVSVTVENSAIDKLFAEIRSPVLIQITSPCDITVRS